MLNAEGACVSLYKCFSHSKSVKAHYYCLPVFCSSHMAALLILHPSLVAHAFCNSITVALYVQQCNKFDAKEEDNELLVPSVVSPLHAVCIMW